MCTHGRRHFDAALQDHHCATAELTNNRTGFSYALTSFGRAFVQVASTSSLPVMDVGAAYGIATLPALHTGASVISVDINEAHLSTIAKVADPGARCRLTLLRDRFPDFDMEPASLGAVYLSQVLPFLRGDEIEVALQKLSRWIAPGGKAIVVSFTPYIQHVSSFLPIFEERRRSGIRWAGQIDDLARFSSEPYFIANLPKEVNHICLDDLQWVFEKHGFVVDEARYFGEEEGALPSGVGLDGRERVGLIARRP
ncbi:class I SAM-dependent methyltransferase [Paraburkholderia sp. NMBU_R16]|uniref:class I SAM-dependent methyltransferase n=1 Tax=Paraburkholderia sp. NMBU_R16 TaxID=2698676 RepID=UPI0020B74344|nr:class I SAM-dependent methyltransferase [Paraburkholderia sp. NMBU_R16]